MSYDTGYWLHSWLYPLLFSIFYFLFCILGTVQPSVPVLPIKYLVLGSASNSSTPWVQAEQVLGSVVGVLIITCQVLGKLLRSKYSTCKYLGIE
jgi:hypothetical protein